MKFTEIQLFEMIQHWITCKENGYLGLSYGGRDIALAAPEGDLNDEYYKPFKIKLLTDIPPLTNIRIKSIFKSGTQITFYLDKEHRIFNIPT